MAPEERRSQFGVKSGRLRRPPYSGGASPEAQWPLTLDPELPPYDELSSYDESSDEPPLSAGAAAAVCCGAAFGRWSNGDSAATAMVARMNAAAIMTV